jgi:hypothetical protein
MNPASPTGSPTDEYGFDECQENATCPNAVATVKYDTLDDSVLLTLCQQFVEGPFLFQHDNVHILLAMQCSYNTSSSVYVCVIVIIGPLLGTAPNLGQQLLPWLLIYISTLKHFFLKRNIWQINCLHVKLTHPHTHFHEQMHVLTYTCVHANICLCMHARTHTHTHTHMTQVGQLFEMQVA